MEKETASEDHPCSVCKKLCKQRCSRCQFEYYCSLECQTKDYTSSHKEQCGLKRFFSEVNSPLSNCVEKKVNFLISHTLMKRCGRDCSKDSNPLYRLDDTLLLYALLMCDDNTSIERLFNISLGLIKDAMIENKDLFPDTEEVKDAIVITRYWYAVKGYFTLKEHDYVFNLQKEKTKWYFIVAALEDD